MSSDLINFQPFSPLWSLGVRPEGAHPLIMLWTSTHPEVTYGPQPPAI